MSRTWLSKKLDGLLPLIKGHLESGKPDTTGLPSAVEERLFATALTELDGPLRNNGLWAKAYTDANGAESEARANYLRQRVRQLATELDNEAVQIEIQVQEEQRLARAPIQRLKLAFARGSHPTADQVMSLVVAASADRSIAVLTEKWHQETLLHWAARHNLSPEARRLIALGADAAARNAMGQQPCDLATDISLQSYLKAQCRRSG